MRKILLLTLLCGVFLFLGNGIMELTNPDEVFYVGTAKEMAQHHTWTVPILFGQPQFEKPILTYWLLRFSLIMFGDTGFGGRFFPALFAFFGVLATWWLALLGHGNQRKAFLAAVILMSSFLYVGMARTVFTDMIFSVLILLSLASFFWAYQRSRWKSVGLVLFCLFAALAVLTKGPLGFVIPFFSVLLFLDLQKQMRFLFCRASLAGLVLFLLVALPWYVLMVQKYGAAFIREFYVNDHVRRIFEAEHGSNDTWYFYPLTMLFGLFPWTVFIGSSLVAIWRRVKRNEKLTVLQQFLVVWIAVVFVIFQVAHSKLVSYIFPLFPALAVLAGDLLDDRLRRRGKKLSAELLISCVLLFALPLTLVFGIVVYAMYLPPVGIVISFALAYAAVILGMIFLVRRRKLLWSVYLLALQAPLVLGLIFFSYRYFKNYVTSKNTVAYLHENYAVEGRVLASKMLIRGTRYYGGWDMAFLNMKRDDFFSAHPVPDLNTDEKVVSFLKSQPVTYGILNKRNWKQLKRISTAYGIRVELLKVMGDQCVLRVLSGP